MRKHVKQEILQLIDSLYQAHREIEDIVKKEQLGSGRSMLGECQEYAINLGNIIEQMEGEDCITVSYLEKYCEVLFRVHESLQTDSNVSKIMKKLDNALANIENSVKHDIPVRKEVVFFPYKASMWDSLESVYLAAKGDPDCDAYCVPIPYFDRNADGSLGQMHYEGNEYPKNIEVIDWKKYNLADRKPDTIYIHNPYDDWNRVTCVHPDYFSNKLKQYTDELVYIPYFVLQEIDPSNQTAIDSIKHFCFQPAIVNADKVILQSENMKQIYVAEYRKAAIAQGLNGAHIDKEALDKKFLGTGSPKFDKVLRTKKEDLEIPQEWLKIIEKPDGTWKKIIFYNTSIGALLEHNEKMLEKMESVFETFKERQDEVALLWRPHPLIPSTIKSMRPQLWVKYQEMVEKYKAEGWGIYDDTADMDRAVVLSDAYYGDASSVVELCQKKSMPVMIQDVIVGDEELVRCGNGNQLGFEIADASPDIDKIWILPMKFNGIFCANQKSQKIDLYGVFPEHLYNGARSYVRIAKVGDKIYCVPFYGKGIVILDVKKVSFDTIELEEEKLGCKFGTALFSGIVLYENYLLAMPKYSRAIVRLNLNNNEVDYITGWAEQIVAEDSDERGYFRPQYVLDNGKVYSPFFNDNAVLELDCVSLDVVVCRLGEGTGYSGICQEGSDFWLVCNTGELIRWNPNEGCKDKFDLQWDSEKTTSNAFTGVLYYESSLHLFPRIEAQDRERNENNIYVSEGEYSLVKEDENNIIYYRYDRGLLTNINKQNNYKREIEIMVDSKEILDLIFKERDNILVESRNLNICHFIARIKNIE